MLMASSLDGLEDDTSSSFSLVSVEVSCCAAWSTRSRPDANSVAVGFSMLTDAHVAAIKVVFVKGVLKKRAELSG